MSVRFSGWEVVDDGASFTGVELASAQKPQNRGVYTMYHGTSVASARLILTGGFKPSAGGMLGPGVYVSRDKKNAANYPLIKSPTGRVTLVLRVRVGRVKRIDQHNLPLRFTWHAHGYDTAWIPPNSILSVLEEDCVFDPKRLTVVGITDAPDGAVEKELKQLLTTRSKRGGDKLCSVCRRKTQKGSQHIKQQCWKCGKTICILQAKHFCPAKP